MKRLLLFFIALIAADMAIAQNWNCLPPDSTQKQWFTNSYHYLRGIRIDSVTTDGSDVIYHAFETRRIYPEWHTGGSWAGGHVRKTPAGDFLFDNLWNDTTLIRTQASVGDSWIFFDDTSSYFYTATVTSIDTATVLGELDSVKSIIIHAFKDSLANAADPAEGLTIILSKAHGFLQAIDIYTFPYHIPGSAASTGFDDYLDYYLRSDGWGGPGGYALDSTNLVFKRTEFFIPTKAEVYDFQVGDVFRRLSAHSSLLFYTFSNNIVHTADTVISIETGPAGEKIYTFRREQSSSGHSGILAPDAPPTTYYFSHTFFTAAEPGGDTVKLFTIGRMPEEQILDTIYYFDPMHGDCAYKSAWYSIVRRPFPTYFEGLSADVTTYQIGLGEIYREYDYGSPDISSSRDTIRQLLYYKKGDVECGTFTPIPTSISAIAANTAVKVFPNPAADILHISAAQSSFKPYTARLTTLTGTITAAVNATTASGCSISTAALPAGLYLLNIIFSDGSRAMQKIIVQH